MYRVKNNKQRKFYLQEKKKFIPCKPHRARAQPRSDLGRNRTVTVGIENKKTNKTLLYTSNNQLTKQLTQLLFKKHLLIQKVKNHAHNNDHFR